MRLFTEMKVRGNRVLKKMDDQVTQENKKAGGRTAQAQTLRHHFGDRGGQHESGAHRDEIFQVGRFPMPADNDGAAKNIGQRGAETKNNAEQDRVHGQVRITVLSTQYPVLSSRRPSTGKIVKKSATHSTFGRSRLFATEAPRHIRLLDTPRHWRFAVGSRFRPTNHEPSSRSGETRVSTAELALRRRCLAPILLLGGAGL